MSQKIRDDADDYDDDVVVDDDDDEEARGVDESGFRLGKMVLGGVRPEQGEPGRQKEP
jgi:hypothetical protein